jgi:uncharacterized DUF497 family protein
VDDVAHPGDAELVEFDDGNELHLAGHGVAADEVVQVFNNDPLWARNLRGRTGNWLMIGRTGGGRPLVVAVLHDEVRAVVRPITARTCTGDEVLRWSV